MTPLAARDWSLIDPRPVIFHCDTYGGYLAAWNGVILPAVTALLIAGKHYWNQNLSQEDRLIPNVAMLSWIYGQCNIDFPTENLYYAFENAILYHVAQTLAQESPSTVITWFKDIF